MRIIEALEKWSVNFRNGLIAMMATYQVSQLISLSTIFVEVFVEAVCIPR